MWRSVLIILLILASLAPARSQPSLYVLGWASPLPVRIERVSVTGGALIQLLAAGDGMSGTIAASADTACLTITAEGLTTSGAGVRFVRTWDAGCYRAWLPFVQIPL